ncbi:MAG TPA: TPM domain-containing protein [Phenylobacterium sp.]|nr:TPM domain-containing protein [Phenylobacterium sp.]
MLTDQDRVRIEAAVKAAEARTRGEIYCVVANESSDYREAPIAWAALAALAAPAVLLLAGIHVTVPDVFGEEWSAAQIGAVAETAAREAVAGSILLQAVLFLVVAIVVSIPPVRRVMTPRSLKRERVRRRAQEQFLAKNLQATRERTGVLIYVSAKERQAELIADEGVAARVDPKVWDKAMDLLIDGIKRGQTAEGFERAIGLCGDILAQHFPAGDSDNPDELPNAVVMLP